MNSIKIAIKNKTKLTTRLETIYDISHYNEPSLLSKFTFKKKDYPDIYFHQGSINDKALDLIQNSKVIIVNTNGIKKQIINKLPNISQNNIFILYPYINNSIEYSKDIKKEFRTKHKIKKETRLILFTGSDLFLSGLKVFLTILSNLQETNFKVIIESNQKQIQNLKLLINRQKLPYEIILLEDYKNKNELFIASDIFILPTKQKLYAQNILKAMNYKTAVFLMSTNYASEIIDTFSLIQSDIDPSTAFKVDALLSNQEELKNIQKFNYKESLKYDFESRLNIINSIIKKYFDI